MEDLREIIENAARAQGLNTRAAWRNALSDMLVWLGFERPRMLPPAQVRAAAAVIPEAFWLARRRGVSIGLIAGQIVQAIGASRVGLPYTSDFDASAEKIGRKLSEGAASLMDDQERADYREYVRRFTEIES